VKEQKTYSNVVQMNQCIYLNITLWAQSTVCLIHLVLQLQKSTIRWSGTVKTRCALTTGQHGPFSTVIGYIPSNTGAVGAIRYCHCDSYVCAILFYFINFIE